MNIYVINVQGLKSKAEREAGTEKRSSFHRDIRVIQEEADTGNNSKKNEYCDIDINQSGKVTSISESKFYVVPDSHQHKVLVVFLQYLIRMYPNNIPPR